VKQRMIFHSKGMILAWAECYKTFYFRTLRMFVIGLSICPWTAYSDVCGLGQEHALELNT
jgi:hypothetical protein